MKKFKLIDEEAAPIAQAMADVTNVFLAHRETKFEVLIAKPLSPLIQATIDQTLSKISDGHFVISSFDIRGFMSKGVKENALIIADIDNNGWWDFNFRMLLLNKFPFKFKIIIYTRDIRKLLAPSKLTLAIYEHPRRLISLFEYILVDRGDKIFFVIPEWFEPNACDKLTIKVHNIFDKRTQVWKQPLKYFEKFMNFNRCVLKVKPFQNYFVDNLGKMHSFVYPIFDIAAQYGNFTPAHFDKYANLSDVHLEIDTDQIFDYVGFNYLTVFRTAKIGFAITDGEFYTNYEKVTMPFDTATWMMLLVTFALAYLTIFAANHTRESVRNLVYGENIRAVGLNIMGTFFGISQPRLPEKSFARYILMMFILFCLVIRTAYQGVLFEFMTSDMRKPHAQTIDQLFEENYEILGVREHIRDMFSEERRAKISNRTFGNMRERCIIFEPNQTKMAFETEWNLDQIIKYSCKKIPLRLPENIVHVGVSINMHKFHYLYFLLEEVMQHIIQAGIPEYVWYYEKWFELSRFAMDPPSKEPKVLALGDLSYGFIIWLVTCGIAFVVFVCELLVWWSSKYFGSKQTSAEETNGNASDDCSSISSDDLNDYVVEVVEIHHVSEENQDDSKSESVKMSNLGSEDTISSQSSTESQITQFERMFCVEKLEEDIETVSIGSLVSVQSSPAGVTSADLN